MHALVILTPHPFTEHTKSNIIYTHVIRPRLLQGIVWTYSRRPLVAMLPFPLKGILGPNTPEHIYQKM